MTSARPFDLQDFLPYLLNQAAETCGRDFQAVYKQRYGLLRSEWRVLFHLGRYGDLTATQIVDLAKTHKTKISRAVRALETKRFLQRCEVATDRRREQLTLTAAGQAVFEDLVRVAQEYDRELEVKLGRDKVDALRKMLHILARS